MKRRDILKTAAAVMFHPMTTALRADEPAARQVVTVTGEIPAERLGTTLPHEHVLVDFIGADQVTPARYDRDQVFQVVLPHLEKAKAAGCDALAECTPAYLGRDPVLLKRLSEASGVKILTNTGYYGARQGKFLPDHARDENADDLAGRWLAEWKEGIEDTGIRPGFIKIGVDNGPLNEVNRKLVQAAARTHLKSGLTIACHTGDGAAANEEMKILRDEGVAPSAWIWVHAQNERDAEIHVKVARAGGWVEFDGVRPDTLDRHIALVSRMKRASLLHRVLISHDAGWYSVGEPRGGTFRPYTTQFKEFLPKLKKSGFSDEEINQLAVQNPAQALAVRVRKL